MHRILKDFLCLDILERIDVQRVVGTLHRMPHCEDVGLGCSATDGAHRQINSIDPGFDGRHVLVDTNPCGVVGVQVQHHVFRYNLAGCFDGVVDFAWMSGSS